MKGRKAEDYSPEELARFAEYRDQRASSRPAKCNGNDKCWVERGPPALMTDSQCVGCGGRPPVPHQNTSRRKDC